MQEGVHDLGPICEKLFEAILLNKTFFVNSLFQVMLSGDNVNSGDYSTAVCCETGEII